MVCERINLVFSKDLMLGRLQREGKGNCVDADVRAILDNLDGQEVGSNSWSRKLYGRSSYSCIGKDGKCYEVEEQDCVTKEEYYRISCGYMKAAADG